MFETTLDLNNILSNAEQDSSDFKSSVIPIIVCTSPDTCPEASDTACHQALVVDNVLDQSKTSISDFTLSQDSLVLDSNPHLLDVAESPDVNKEVERAFENGPGHHGM